MVKRLTYLTSFVLFISLVSCATSRRPSATHLDDYYISGPRTIILDGDTISEKDVGGFRCWYCTDYIDGSKTLVEVGYFKGLGEIQVGFVLYDGSYSGTMTFYRRTGLEHRWDWGPNLGEYSFVVKTDGTGLYYDFSSVEEGESTKAKEVYKCRER